MNTKLTTDEFKYKLNHLTNEQKEHIFNLHIDKDSDYIRARAQNDFSALQETSTFCRDQGVDFATIWYSLKQSIFKHADAIVDFLNRMEPLHSKIRVVIDINEMDGVFGLYYDTDSERLYTTNRATVVFTENNMIETIFAISEEREYMYKIGSSQPTLIIPTTHDRVLHTVEDALWLEEQRKMNPDFDLEYEDEREY